MSDKPNFYVSDVCASHLHCDTCRARHAGRIWRKTLRRAFRLPEDNFDCPEGKPWTDDRATADRPDTPRPKPCGGCGKTGTPTNTEAPIYNVEEDGIDNGNVSGDNDHPVDPWEAASPPLYGETRASCQECVEKHIGAAMVILSETKIGYPHFLLAVGHLHEAEEEAQAWPDLAAAIRATRKELQTTGTVPEWEGVMKGLEGTRT